MKRFLIAAALAFAAVGPAIAADLPEPAPPPPPRAPATYIPTMAPVYNWGGIYFGINGGYGFGSTNWTAPGLSSGAFNASGYVVGVTVGANFQADAFVFGLEGDLDTSGIDGSVGATCSPVNCETKNTWLSTFRGRVGYAADRVLFYGTAGGALGNIEAANVPSGFITSTKAGWTAGAGVEAAFADNWTARIEYLFVDLQNASFSGNHIAGPVTVTLDSNVVRVGVDYKFR